MKYAGPAPSKGTRPCCRSPPGMLGAWPTILSASRRKTISKRSPTSTTRQSSAAARPPDTTPRTFAQRKAWVESHHDPYAVVRHHRACHGCSHGRRRTDHRLLRAVRVLRPAPATTASPTSPTTSPLNGRAGERAPSHWPNCLTNAETATCASLRHHLRRQPRIHRTDETFRIHPIRTHAPSRHRLHRNHARHELLASRPVST